MTIFRKTKTWLQKHDISISCHIERFTPRELKIYNHIDFICTLIPTIVIKRAIVPVNFYLTSLYEKCLEINIRFLFWGFAVCIDQRCHV